ncbi:DUF4430 domain-containing protein [Streptomyces sp. NPDC048491]|uniref:DUF4430 domain-containing protein n=1 Tax=Streptomyces sp. NPDC048491 TaxID=3157207 RepID=UPI0034356442
MRQTALRRAILSTTAMGLALTATPALACPTPNPNAPVFVTVTVKGPNSTLFNGRVRTKGHDVTTTTGGTHKCDGTNGAKNPAPVPTPTAALDDAAHQRGFAWDGTWYASFDDFSVDTVKNVSGGTSAYWNISVNGTPTPVGGCQLALKSGDRVAFTWTSF